MHPSAMMFRVVVACTLVAAGVSAPAAQVYTGEPLGESPEVCAARETLEETGITVSNVEFVAITNDVLADAGKHYLTVWMRGEPSDAEAQVADAAEIRELGWFARDELPAPLHIYFQNLLDGRCWPRAPANLPWG